jgi:hypothetical protein
MFAIGVILVTIPFFLMGYNGILHKYFSFDIYTTIITSWIILSIGAILLVTHAFRKKEAVTFVVTIGWSIIMAYLILASGA